jgi:DNA-binding transcriptional LysR family regulator
MLSDLDLSLLRTLVAVAEAPSQAEAARSLGITQPTLSYLLKRLESQLPSPLFQREGRRNRLTRYGQAVKDASRHHLERLRLALETIDRQYASPRTLRLRIGCRIDRVAWIERLITFPGQIEIQDLSSEQALARLLEHEIDLAIVHERPSVPDLVCRRLFSSGHRFIVHEDLLAGGKLDALARDPGFLARVPAIRYRVGDPLLTHWLKSHGADPSAVRYRITCPNWMNLLRWVSEKEGYAIVPDDLGRALSELEGVRQLRIPDPELPGIVFYAAYFPELRTAPGFARGFRIRSSTGA